MPFTVVLDTCVIYPAHLRDTLLRQAERGLYRALWSEDILDELHRNLVEGGFDATSVDRLLGEMRGAFPDAEIGGYRSLIDGLMCDPKDRHVLAAACGTGQSGRFQTHDRSRGLGRIEIHRAQWPCWAHPQCYSANIPDHFCAASDDQARVNQRLRPASRSSRSSRDLGRWGTSTTC